MEQAIISGVAHDRSEAKITVAGVPDRVGVAAQIFRIVAAADINIDMIVQNISAATTGRTDISFTLPRDDGPGGDGGPERRAAGHRLRHAALRRPDRQGVADRRGHALPPRGQATFFGALADAAVNIEMISTSEIRISVVVDQKDVDVAVTAAHRAFDLDASEVEAVVYGGTGR